jgi:uncharacterized DUF497 family protein
MEDINHTALPKEVVRPNTPTVRPQTADIWKHVSRIAKHDVPDRAMKTECTHVCVYRLDDEDGEKRYCNTPLKLFRASSAKAAPWSTSAALAHFKKKHEDSSSARKQKAGATKRQTRLSECMHAAGSQGIQSISSRKSTYALSENEKVLSAIARWAVLLSCARKRHWHSHSTEPTIESSSLPREDGISICRKRRQHNLRSRWLL